MILEPKKIKSVTVSIDSPSICHEVMRPDVTDTKTPAGRWGDPEDLAGPAVFLASGASDFVNGQILYVDGGIQAYFGKQP